MIRNLIEKIKNKRKISFKKISIKRSFSKKEPIINKKQLDLKITLKVLLITVIAVFSISKAYSWLYEYYISSGAILSVGKIKHEIIQYNSAGEIIDDGTSSQTIVYESNMSNVTRTSRFIEVKNAGTLDMEYSMAFSLEGTTEAAGIMYYRLYEVTNEVLASTTSLEYNTRLKAYAANNPVAANIETDATKPISNMTTLNNLIKTGVVETNNNVELKSKYYRLDFGMYSAVNTSLYSEESLSVHLDVYSSQIGAIQGAVTSGQIWEVSNEAQFREVLLSAITGDTVKLSEDINIDGSLVFSKRINIDTNEHSLTMTGDLVYDFVNAGELIIDVTGAGRIEVGNNWMLNTPKSEVHIMGSNKTYDMFVGGTVHFNGIQDGEKDGILLENVNIVKSKSTYMNIDVIVMSNTRLTLAPGVHLGFVTAADSSTNIEIVNNGIITQLQFSNMNLLNSFTKPQIYVYNLGTILGTLGSTSIILPATARPYLGPNNGNTLIIKGITSSDITVSGSEHFENEDIQNNYSDASVIPVDGEENAYIVYIRESTVSIESLLTEYFTLKGEENPTNNISNIKKLIVYTLNAQYIENEDFDFLKSNRIPLLEYLNLDNSKVQDNATGTIIYNKIKDNALYNKTSLKTVILPKTVTEIGSYAFYNVNLGYVSNLNEEFNFLIIPSTVTNIGDYAFNKAKYVKQKAITPATVGDNTYNNSNNGTKHFVGMDSIETYQNAGGYNSINIHQDAELSDDKKYFIFTSENGVGISYIINNLNTSTSLGIPEDITLDGTTYTVTAIGTSAYRQMNITNASGILLNLPDTITKIDAYAFYGLNITSTTFTNVKKIGNYAFYNTKIDRVVANNATVIGDYAFYGSLATVVSLNNINSIGAYAFANNSMLYEINFSNIRTIGNYAFYNCPNVSKVFFNNQTTQMVNNTEEIVLKVGEYALFNTWGSYIDGRLRIYVPNGNNDNGTSYLNLYKTKFNSVREYIYLTGYSVGSYIHYAVDYDLTEYTVREITILDKNNNLTTGWEIISYQGADLTGTYQIPSTLTANNKTQNVISIGEYAFRHTAGTGSNDIMISNDNIISIGNYAFYQLGINSVVTPNVISIGDYAFSETKIKEAKFDSLKKLGNYAMSGINTLYSLNIGAIELLGTNCISDNENLEQLFISNTNKNIIVNGIPWSNIGTNSNKRLRIYVPEGTEQLSYYKNLIPSYAQYIYETGTIVGSFVNAPLLYDIGEYAVKEKTITNHLGVNVTGWEIIEYHGADLTGAYNIPETLTITSSSLTAIAQNINKVDDKYAYNITVKNNTNENINSWQMNIDLPSTVSLVSVTNARYEIRNNILYVYNDSNNGTINALGNVTFSIELETLIDNYMPYISNVSVINATGRTLPVIEIGPNAFIHTTVAVNERINIDNQNIIIVGDNAFKNVEGIEKLRLINSITIGTSAFENNKTIKKITLTNLNTIRSNAFLGSENLFIIDFGSVQTIEENVLTNAPYLEQVFFNVNSLDLAINYNAISNVGSLSNNRLRFYVTDGKDINNREYVNTYKSLFNSEYNDYFYPLGYIMGSYSQANSPYDIGSYSIRETIKNNYLGNTVTGWEIVEYHGSDLDSNFTIDNDLTVIRSNLSVKAIYDSSWGNYIHKIYVEIKNDGNEPVNSWQFKLSYPSGSSVNLWNGDATQYDKYAIINNMTYNGTIAPGATFRLEMHVTTSSATYTPIVTDAHPQDAPAINYPIISIGDYAFRHTLANGSAEFDITSPNLIYIGESAFYNLPGIINLSGTSITTIGPNAFVNNKIETVNLPNLLNIGESAFRNNSSLHYMNIGTVLSLPDNVLNGAVNLTQLFISNENVNAGSEMMDIYIGTDALKDIGTAVGSRFRIYVPQGIALGSLTYAKAYKNTLPENLKLYIYEKGYLTGNDYSYAAIPYNIKEYMVKDATINNIDGWEIIDYHGANITSTYSYPNTITANGVTKNVIAIGDNAFRHAMTSNANFDINTTDLQKVGEFAFYQFKGINKLIAPNLNTIGANAFRYNSINYVALTGLNNIGNYALADNTDMYYIDLGNINNLPDGLLYNNSKIVIMYFRSIDVTSNKMNITIGENALYNMGDKTTDRLRIYVPIEGPNGDETYVQAYKNTLPSTLSPYVYETGHLVGTYMYSDSNYPILDYSVKKATIDGVEGWHIIDYHGADASSTYVIPSYITVNEETLPVISVGESSYRWTKVTSGQTWNVDFPSSVRYVGDYAFYQRSLYSMTGYDLNYLGAYVCYQCRSIQTVSFGAVTNIGEYAFYNTTVRSVSLGLNVVEIGNYAFYNTYANNQLSTFYISTVNPPRIYANTLPPRQQSWFWYNYNITIYVPYASESAYENADYWSVLAARIYPMGNTYQNYVYNVIGDNQVEITGYTNTSVSSLTIPNTFSISGTTYQVTSVSGEAFDNLSSLRTLTLPRYLKTIGENFLNGNSSVNTIRVASNSTTFKATNGVLFSYDGTSLIKYPPAKTTSSYELPTSTRVIISGAFQSSQYLESITFNENLLSIAAGSFTNCQSLRTITFTGTTPPYLLGFNVFPVYNNTSVRYPSSAFSTYNSNIFYTKYVNNAVEN